MAKKVVLQQLLYLQLLLLVIESDGNSGCFRNSTESIVAVCVNAIPSTFRETDFKFNRGEEILECRNCNLTRIPANTFSIPGNKLRILDISNSHIKALEEDAFAGLVFVTVLLLHDNYIELIGPKTFRGLKNLQQLNLSNNRIKNLFNESFIELEKLELLNLSGSRIKSIEINAFKGLEKLQSLNLENNQIERYCFSFQTLHRVKSINLNKNRIKKILGMCKGNKDCSCFMNGATTLTERCDINLGSNRIHDLPANAFVGLTLNYLDLSNNKIRNIDKNAFPYMSVIDLNLNRNHISNLDGRLFQKLDYLWKLDLSFNSIREFRTEFFDGLNNMRSLNVSYNKIGHLKDIGINFLPNLEILDLRNNSIIEVNYKGIQHRLPKLVELHLQGNPISCNLTEILRFYNRLKLFIDTCYRKRKSADNSVNETERTTYEAKVSKDVLFLWFGMYFCVFVLLIMSSFLVYLQVRIYGNIRKFPMDIKLT